MRLVVFDIDGTLTDTVAADERCFGQALATVFGLEVEAVSADWQCYPEVTDAGIAATALELAEGRGVEPRELLALETALVEQLTAAFDEDPNCCRALPGAVEIVSEFERRPEWVVALATGGFRRSALLKLLRAGFEPPAFLATASEAAVRADILARAIALAEAELGEMEATVVLGDGVWDVTTAAKLGLPCIGVGRGATAEKLLSAGARTVLPDYSDLEAAIELISATAARG